VIRTTARVLATLAGILALAAGALDAHEITGTLPSGAAYRIAAPDGWRAGDPLVFFNHGFNFADDIKADLGPLAESQLAAGYAVAASGYRQSGWALLRAVDDNAELLAAFRARFGEPGSIVATGASMGGLVALKQAEDPRFPNVTGVLALCPAAAGAQTWDQALDVRLSYDVICRGVEDGELPAGAAPTPWAYDLDRIPADLDDALTDPGVLAALAPVTQCTGLALPAERRTDDQQQRLARLKAVVGVDDERLLAAQLAVATFGLGDLVRAPEKLAGGNPFDTRGVVYRDAGVDAAVPRFAPDPLAQFELVRSSTLTGRTAARILAMHTSGDQLLPIEQLQEIIVTSPTQQRGRVPFDQAQLLRVDEQTPTHCGFSRAELGAGWEALRSWIASGSKPPAVAVQSRCRNLVAGGVADGACRIAQYDCCVPSIDAKIAPRPQYDRGEISADVAGTWYTPGRNDEGFLVEPQADGRVLVTWYTYPLPGEAGDQLWLYGVGELVGNGFATETLLRLDGGGFAGNFDPARMTRTSWGKLTMVHDGDDRATLRFEGPPGYGSGTRALVRLSGQYGQTVLSPPPPPIVSHSGSFYDGDRPGEGIVVHLATRRTDPPQPTGLFLVWFTYDDDGRPRWLYGRGEQIPFDPPRPIHKYSFTLLRSSGARFGDAFDPAAIDRAQVGSVFLTFGEDSCNRVRVDWTLFGTPSTSGTLEYVRASSPSTGGCAR